MNRLLDMAATPTTERAGKNTRTRKEKETRQKKE